MRGTTLRAILLCTSILVSFVAGRSCSSSSIADTPEKVHADSIVKVQNEVILNYTIKDSVAKDSIKKLNIIIKHTEPKIIKLSANADSLKKVVKAQVADSAWKHFEPLINNFEERLNIMAAQNSALQNVIRVQEGQIRRADSTIGVLRGFNEQLAKDVGKLNSKIKKQNILNGVAKVATIGILTVVAVDKVTN